jgi:hypothetical protein
MIMEQVDLVHVEDAAVRGGEQARLVVDLAGAERLLQIEGADHPVLGRADRQLDQPGRPRGRLAGRVRPVRAVRVRMVGVTAEAAVLDHVEGGEDVGERPDHGGLGSALLAADQYPADFGGDRGENQGQGQVVAADDR